MSSTGFPMAPLCAFEANPTLVSFLLLETAIRWRVVKKQKQNDLHEIRLASRRNKSTENVRSLTRGAFVVHTGLDVLVEFVPSTCGHFAHRTAFLVDLVERAIRILETDTFARKPQEKKKIKFTVFTPSFYSRPVRSSVLFLYSFRKESGPKTNKKKKTQTHRINYEFSRFPLRHFLQTGYG